MRAVLISLVWALNCWYIAGFAHALGGGPEIGPLVGIVAFAAAMLLLRPRSSTRREVARRITA
jgi:hypothetical protein